MADNFKRKLDSCGVGGIHCRCCKPNKKKRNKPRWWNRYVRRVLKQKEFSDE